AVRAMLRRLDPSLGRRRGAERRAGARAASADRSGRRSSVLLSDPLALSRRAALAVRMAVVARLPQPARAQRSAPVGARAAAYGDHAGATRSLPRDSLLSPRHSLA